MSIMVSPKIRTLTASSGSASGSLLLSYGFIKQIVVKAATSTTTFDVKLTNTDSVIVYEEIDIIGELNELLELPFYGNLTLNISNASVDENFTVYTAARE